MMISYHTIRRFALTFYGLWPIIMEPTPRMRELLDQLERA